MGLKKGVKAIFSKDGKTVTTTAYPSKKGYTWKPTTKTWKNKCPSCGGKLKFGAKPKQAPEGELTCKSCDADFCCVSGLDKAVKPRWKLTPATVTSNSTTKVAESQTQKLKCNLSKAEALSKAKSMLSTSNDWKASLTVPLMKNLETGDLVEIDLPGFDKGTYYVDKVKEDIDNQTMSIDLIKGKNHLTSKYSGSYLFKDKQGHLLYTNTGNPLNAKTSTVNINIGLKDKSEIGKKIKLQGQTLGTVDKIYKWLKVTNGGGVGGWKYKKYGNHRVKTENPDKFGSKSAEQCWKTKTANCCDFAWLMAKLGEGAGKKIGVRKGEYTSTDGHRRGHMWNTYKTKVYDCSQAGRKNIDWKDIEQVK